MFFRAQALRALAVSAAVLLALVPAAPLAAAAPAEGVIRGIVIDGEGRPVAGANVKVEGTPVNAKTDKGGLFGVKVKPGSYKVTISAPGYASDTQSAAVKAGAAAEISALLMKP